MSTLVKLFNAKRSLAWITREMGGEWSHTCCFVGRCFLNWCYTQTALGFRDTKGSPNLGQTTKPYNNQQKKRTCRIVDFAVPADHRIKLKESEKKDKYLDSARELKKTVELASDDYTSYNWSYWYSHQRIGTRTGGLGNNWTNGDNPHYCIIEIVQNTEKSPGDLRRFAVTQTPVKDHQQNAYAKNSQGECTTQHLSLKMTHTNSYGTLIYKRIT